MANQYTANPVPSDLNEHYLSGMSQHEVAAHYGVSQKVVFGWMRKAGIQARVAAKRNQKGSLNSSWKGDAATYAAFHYRLQSLKGTPSVCEVCGTTDTKRTYDWANLTGRYHDPEDYKRMCRSCHWKHDGKIKNIKHMRGRS